MMKRVLISYPSLFRCQSKFDRKVSRLLSQLDHFEVLFLDDPNGYIQEIFNSDIRVNAIQSIDMMDLDLVTHAIVFDDGEEFPELRSALDDKSVSLRWIKIKLTRVINLKREPSFEGQADSTNYHYIGRGSYWGNPHSMHEEGESREEVIRKFKYDFDYDKFINIDPSKVHELAGKRLGCFCKPAPCHGDVLADFLNSYDDGK